MRFCDYHPLVNITWFIAVGTVTMLYMNPVTTVITLVFACLMLRRLGGSRFGAALVPMMLATLIINPLFSHEGATILAYFPSGNPLTLESIIYGIAAALMLGSALILCLAFSRIVTTDKLHYLIGRVLPSLALTLSMILRFVPRFVSHLKDAYNARIGMYGIPGKKRDKVKHAAKAVSGTLTWALENSLNTADSMKSRGWGLSHSTSFTPYRLTERDKDALAAIILMAVYFLSGIVYGALEFRFYPTVKIADVTPFGISCVIVYAFLCAYPLIMEVQYGSVKN